MANITISLENLHDRLFNVKFQPNTYSDFGS